LKVSEFKAWFEGFTESIEGLPNKKQWDRIKEKIAAVDGKEIVYREYVDRWYSRPYTWTTYGIGSSSIAADTKGSSTILLQNGTSSIKTVAGVDATKLTAAQPVNYTDWQSNICETKFDSHTAMYALGKSEALEVEGSK
jgi:hypothetical protein